VARAEKATFPAFGRADLEILERRATQVGARTFDDEVFGLNRTRLIGCIVRLLLDDLGIRVIQFTNDIWASEKTRKELQRIRHQRLRSLMLQQLKNDAYCDQGRLRSSGTPISRSI